MPMIRPTARVLFSAGVATAIALAGTLALAQSGPNFRPGLWEESVERAVEGGGAAEIDSKAALAALANMPPEQRKMVERMLAGQGLAIQADAGGVKAKQQYCIAPGKPRLSWTSTFREVCTQTLTPNGANWLVASRCEDREDQPGGEMRGVLTLQGQTGYRGDFEGRSAQQGTYRIKTEGRWLSADCGSVKPD
jgi:hypothetical protein